VRRTNAPHSSIFRSCRRHQTRSSILLEFMAQPLRICKPTGFARGRPRHSANFAAWR
jgi:hypothetical protein